jgi:CheY-like chemotaxis protein
MRGDEDSNVISLPRRKRSSSVLIVDDDEEVRHVLRIMFELEGFDIAGEARTGLEAIPLALKYQPDVVLLDYLMPGMNGEETAKLMRTIAPEARIVAFSAILDEKPEWSDSYLNKERVSEVIPLLERLIT